MGGGCVIPNFGVLQMAGSRARARKKKFPKKAKIFGMGVDGLEQRTTVDSKPSKISRRNLSLMPLFRKETALIPPKHIPRGAAKNPLKNIMLLSTF